MNLKSKIKNLKSRTRKILAAVLTVALLITTYAVFVRFVPKDDNSLDCSQMQALDPAVLEVADNYTRLQGLSPQAEGDAMTYTLGDESSEFVVKDSAGAEHEIHISPATSYQLPATSYETYKDYVKRIISLESNSPTSFEYEVTVPENVELFSEGGYIMARVTGATPVNKVGPSGEELLMLRVPQGIDSKDQRIDYKYTLEKVGPSEREDYQGPTLTKFKLTLAPARSWQLPCASYPIAIHQDISPVSYSEAIVMVGQDGDTDDTKDGDILMVKPAGWNWGKEERKRFVIVKIPQKLASERQELMKKEEGLRTYGIDYTKLATSEQLEDIRNPSVSAAPLDAVPAIQAGQEIIQKKENPKTSVIPTESRLAIKPRPTIENKDGLLVKTAHAQTSVNVSTIGTASRDYSTITLWEDGVDGTLTQTERGEAYNDSEFDEEVLIDGSENADATKYIWLTAATGEEHKGIAGTGVKLDPTTLTETGGRTYDIKVKDEYTIVEKLEITETASGTSTDAHDTLRIEGGGANSTLRNNIVHDVDVESHNIGIGVAVPGAGTTYVYNNIIYNIDIGASGAGLRTVLNSSGEVVHIYNNTVHDGGIGLENLLAANSQIVENNISTGNGTDFNWWPGSGSITSNNNISEDSTADNQGGSNHIEGVTVANQYVSTVSGTENLHLKSGAAGFNTGKDLSSTFTTDIDGDKRPIGSVWDIGADEFDPVEARSAIAQWKFDEGVDNSCPGGEDTCDSSGNANEGVSTGGTAWQTEDLCVDGKCLYFDMTDDVVTVTNAPEIDPDKFLAHGFTFETWFRANSDGELSAGQIFKFGATTVSTTNEGTDGLADLEVLIDLTTANATASIVNGITLNKWHHLAVAYTDDGDDEVTVYIDGKNVGASTGGDGVPEPGTPDLEIGGGSSNNYHGFVDEFKIYDYERTAAQVKSDFIDFAGSSGSSAAFADPQKWLSDGLVGYWDFPEATGSATLDKSGNGNDGTLTNMQETGIADSGGSVTTLIDTDGSLSSTDDVYIGMTLEITTGSCGGAAGESRTISDYTGGTNTIEVGTAFSAAPDGCGYIIKHQVGGKFGNGVDFDGDTDYVDIVDSTSLDSISTTNAYTVSTWVNPNRNYQEEASDWHYFVGRSATQMQLGYEGWNDAIAFSVMNTSSTYFTAIDADDSYMTSGQWYHVVGVYDGNNVHLYIDGQLIDTTSFTGTVSTGTNVRIGGQGNRSFNGLFDDARIYNRALSPAEVQKLYNWAPGPVGYWPMDEGTGTGSGAVKDRSGNGNNGTMEASMTESDWVPGKFGSTLDFDGSNDYILISDNATLRPVRDITLSAWVRSPSSPGAFKHIVSEQRSAGSIGYSLKTGASGEIFFEIYTSSAVSSPDGGTGIWDNNWHLVTGLYDGTDVILFVDGVSQGSTQTSGNIDYWLNQGVRIGSFNGVGNYFTGQIDDVKIYNYARTQAQIIEDMNAGHPAPGSPVGSPVGHWKFDTYADSSPDSSPQENNVDLSGSCDGTPGVSPCPSFSPNGKFGHAYGFGVSSMTRGMLGTGGDFDFSGSDAFTLSAWINSTNIPGSGEQDGILTKWDATSQDRSFLMALYNNDGDSTGNISVQAYDESVDEVISVSSTTDGISTSEWYHVLMTFNGGTAGAADDLKLYLDGNLVGGNTANASFLGIENFSTTNFIIGNFDSNDTEATNDNFDGLIDEVKIYNFALTSDQVKTEYNQGSSAVWGATSSNTSGVGSWGAASAYCPPGSTDTCTPPVGEWLFDEKTGSTANDTSGNGNNGTISNGEWRHRGDCHSGACQQATIDSSQDFATITDPTSGILDFSDTVDFTIAGWVRFSSIESGGTNTYFIEKGAGDINEAGYNALVRPDRAACRYIDGNGSGLDVAEKTGLTIEDSTWHHYVCVMDRNGSEIGTTGYHLFIDGILQASDTSLTEGDGSSTKDLTLGEAYTSREFTGAIDEVRIYDYARTPAQIAWEYNRGGPVGWWQFDECSGTVAYDNSGNGNNGTITPGGAPNASVGTCSSGAGDEMWDNGTNGKRNASLDFDGTDDEVSISYSSEFDFDDEDFTVTAWVKPSTLAWDIVAGHWGAGSDKSWKIAYNVTQGYYYFFVSTDGSAEASIACGATNSVSTGNWYFITAVYDHSGTDKKCSTNAGTMYSNVQSGVNGSSEDLYIGAESSGTSNFDGQIDEVRIYNYALTQQQILNEYNSGAVYFGP